MKKTLEIIAGTVTILLIDTLFFWALFFAPATMAI